MEILHKSNILLHIITGSIGLLLGLIALISIKGDKIHNTSGKYFLRFISIVILTGFIGVFVFKRNTFLLVITVLSGYVAFSGYRTLLLKSNIPKRIDIIVAIISLLTLAYFLYYFKSIGMIWSPIIIYSTVGALLFIISYDFMRYLIPRKKYLKHRVWIYEHIYKMTSAFSALLAAFIGTVFEKYQPHSQYIPSALGMLIIFGFIVYVYKYGLRKLPK
ncbi:hypothetical protein D1816_11135 [Aquimarina sp. AD10]|uniref:DUF2306 domain-containing protein n=1 Tax=Aquimarina aggregata TaxID=1642818 RepID=A0A162Y8S7_9FLAO|nr:MULTISPECIES: hypothetical protein [Aquimarina]AXT60875.1 hypothetical protein D1816_11135 [Aquimarina sp. AD10]KZS38987.1 hypothetical protein AWE51_10490 [Aquimarina aggregata]RKM93048.1 hypothetical protein D7033_20310 [Aquimarina sp. AD10]